MAPPGLGAPPGAGAPAFGAPPGAGAPDLAPPGLGAPPGAGAPAFGAPPGAGAPPGLGAPPGAGAPPGFGAAAAAPAAPAAAAPPAAAFFSASAFFLASASSAAFFLAASSSARARSSASMASVSTQPRSGCWIHSGSRAGGRAPSTSTESRIIWAMSRTSGFVSSSSARLFTPSDIIVLQNGQPIAIADAPVSRASEVRLTLMRSPMVSSIHMRAPPAPQQKPVSLLRGISTRFAPDAPISSRGASKTLLWRPRKHGSW